MSGFLAKFLEGQPLSTIGCAFSSNSLPRACCAALEKLRVAIDDACSGPAQ